MPRKSSKHLTMARAHSAAMRLGNLWSSLHGPTRYDDLDIRLGKYINDAHDAKVLVNALIGAARLATDVPMCQYEEVAARIIENYELRFEL